VVLAETLGSCGAAFAAPEGHRTVGLDINANHLKGTTSGWVTGITRPVEKNADWTYYHSLGFAQSTGWDEFEDQLAT